MCANSPATYNGNGQIAIASGGNLYIYSGGVFSLIPNDGVNFFGASSVTFLDGYFIVVTPNSSQFQISALNDGTTWSSADVAILEGQADGLVNAISDKEYLYLIGGGGGGDVQNYGTTPARHCSRFRSSRAHSWKWESARCIRYARETRKLPQTAFIG